MSESLLGKNIQILWSKLGHRLFRFNTGQTWIGQSRRFDRTQQIIVQPGDVLIKSARVFHAGFTGAPDYWGYKKITITPDMVGTVIAQAAFVETKSTKGRATEVQSKFIIQAKSDGAHAVIARTFEESINP